MRPSVSYRIAGDVSSFLLVVFEVWRLRYV